MVDGERAVAQQQQEKLHFYLLSLVFTLLGLSVQTSKLGASPIADWLELAGWLFLLLSGLAGLWYMEMNPVIRLKMAQKSEFEEYAFKLMELQRRGQTHIHVLESSSDVLISEMIKNRQDAVAALGPYIAKLEGHQFWRYTVFRYAFVLGVVLIAVARALPALCCGLSPLAV